MRDGQGACLAVAVWRGQTESLTLEIMSDGREEREELRKRREQEKSEDREDRIDRGDADEWGPERVDS
jgi:hypothetical protein